MIESAQSESWKSVCHIGQPRADEDLHLSLRKLTKSALGFLLPIVISSHALLLLSRQMRSREKSNKISTSC